MRTHMAAIAGLIVCVVWIGATVCASGAESEETALATALKAGVRALDYDDETAGAFAALVTSWTDDDGAALAERWNTALADARGKHDDGTLSDEELAKVEARVIGELAAALGSEVKHKRRTGALTLDRMVKKKTAQSVVYAQAVYVVGKALGLGVEPVAVTYPIADEQPMLSGHYACLAKLADGATVSIDPSFAPAVSAPFDFATTYRKDGSFYVRLDGADMPGLHQRLRLLDHDGLRAAACLGRAEAEYDRRHWEASREYADKAIRLDPGSAVAYRVRGVAWGILWEHDKALADAERALALDPQCAEAWNTIAASHLVQGNDNEALEALGKAIEMNPKYASPLMNRVGVLERLGRSDEADADAAKAFEIAPKDPDALSWRATHLAGAGKPDKALEAISAVVDFDPESAEGYARRATFFVWLGRRGEAFADCAQAIKLEPDDALIRIDAGYVFYQLDEINRALEQFSKAVKLDPELPFGHYWRALALWKSGDSWLIRTGVLRDLTKAIELDPRYVPAYIARGDFYVVHDEPEKALGDLSKAIELAPKYDWAYACRAAAHVALGDYESALEDLNTAIELSPDYAYCYYKRGTCHAELGYDDEAVADWRKAVELDPELAELARRKAEDYGLEDELGDLDDGKGDGAETDDEGLGLDDDD